MIPGKGHKETYAGRVSTPVASRALAQLKKAGAKSPARNCHFPQLWPHFSLAGFLLSSICEKGMEEAFVLHRDYV